MSVFGWVGTVVAFVVVAGVVFLYLIGGRDDR